MPPQVRQAYEQAMATLPKGSAEASARPGTKLVFNGREYASAEEMPAEVRALYEQVIGKLDADQNGVPDVLEMSQGTPAQAPLENLPQAPPVVSPDESRMQRLLVAGAFLVLTMIVLVILIAMVLARVRLGG